MDDVHPVRQHGREGMSEGQALRSVTEGRKEAEVKTRALWPLRTVGDWPPMTSVESRHGTYR